MNVQFSLNGKEIKDSADDDLKLIQYIRRELKLTGAKEGCGQAQCGTCTVLINGEPVRSCAVKMKDKRLRNASIVTIEGFGTSKDDLHPIQKAFIWAGAIQCGFCTPGMILSTKGLLDKNRSPTRSEIRIYLKKRNLCRCTGYQKIIDAIEDAAGMMRGEKSRLSCLPEDTPLSFNDAYEKVTGKTQFADDIEMDGMIFGKLVFASEPHARLIKLDTTKAEAMPGVIGVITAEDIPGSRKIGLKVRDQTALVDVGEETRCIADMIAAVFAETPERAASAAKNVIAEYIVLPGVYSMEEASTKDAPIVCGDLDSNLFFQNNFERGDVDKIFDQCHAIVEGEFSLSSVEHGYLEPEAAVAKPDGNGGVEVLYPTQSIFEGQEQIRAVLNLPREKVRVVQLPTGGAFGGKEGLVFQHLVAIAAVKYNRPAKITFNRRESLRSSSKKHPMKFNLRLGLGKDGTFIALNADIDADKGAYASSGAAILSCAMAFSGGPYFIPNVRINGRSWFTNKVMSGAMRGFGANQANFAIESLVDMAARKLKIDPFEIRLRNGLKPGLPTVADHLIEPGVDGIIETIAAARLAFKKVEVPAASRGAKIGVGIACGVKSNSYGNAIPDSSGARVTLTSDGRCSLCISHHELGQGAYLGQARIASEILGVPVDLISISTPDTAKTPYAGSTAASRQTFMSGKSTAGACYKLKSDLLAKAARELDIMEPAALTLEGDAIVHKMSGKCIKLEKLGENFTSEFREIFPETAAFPKHGEKSRFGAPDFKSRRIYLGYSYGTQIAWVEVNKITGEVKVLKILTIDDVGRVLNKRAVEGQQEGGVSMGIGYALSEEFKVEKGFNITKSLKQCGLPTADDVPDIITGAVEVPHPLGPLGMKGMAENSSLATAPAIANAIFDAIGIRMKHLPITKDSVKKTLEDNGKSTNG